MFTSFSFPLSRPLARSLSTSTGARMSAQRVFVSMCARWLRGASAGDAKRLWGTTYFQRAPPPQFRWSCHRGVAPYLAKHVSVRPPREGAPLQAPVPPTRGANSGRKVGFGKVNMNEYQLSARRPLAAFY